LFGFALPVAFVVLCDGNMPAGFLVVEMQLCTDVIEFTVENSKLIVVGAELFHTCNHQVSQVGQLREKVVDFCSTWIKTN